MSNYSQYREDSFLMDNEERIQQMTDEAHSDGMKTGIILGVLLGLTIAVAFGMIARHVFA